MNIIFFYYNLNIFKFTNLYDGLVDLSKTNKLYIIGAGNISKGVKTPKNMIIYSIKKPRFKFFKNLYLTILMLRKSIKVIKSKKINSIFILNDIFPQILGYLVSKITKIPYFIDYRGNISYERKLDRKKTSFLKRNVLFFIHRFYDILEDYTLEKAKAITCNNSLSKKMLLRRKIKNDRIHVVWHGVTLDKFSPEKYTNEEKIKFRRTLDLDSDDFVLLFVGRLVPNKGLIYLFRAIKEINIDLPKIKLLVVGYGPNENELKEYIVKNELKEIKLLGKQPHDKIPLFYLISDLFILPSLSEGFPNVILEAMASAKPFISTKVGDVPELCRKAENDNILIDSRNEKQIIDGIKYYYKNRDKILEIGKKNREFISKNISWRNFVDKIIRIFRTT